MKGKKISWKGTESGCRVTSSRVIIISPTCKLCVDRKFIAISTAHWTATNRLLRDPPWLETQQLEMTVFIMELLYVAAEDSCRRTWLIMMWFVLAILTQYLVKSNPVICLSHTSCCIPPVAHVEKIVTFEYLVETIRLSTLWSCWIWHKKAQ